MEAFLYERERDLFDLYEVITLYDLTNTYFEGTAHANANAAFGKSKEKRTDCPLVTLALVLDASGFPKRSRVFAGNAAEAQTLAEMVQALAPRTRETPPTVVVDAGIATEENIAWLNEQGYRYVVVSRRRHRQFDPDDACLIKEDGPLTIRAQRVVNDDTGEVELYCHSTQREQKERGIAERFAQRFEAELQKLADGLHKPRTVKRYETVFERIGRLKQKYPRAARYDEISVEQDEAGPNAKVIRWQRITPVDDTLPGVYCLRSNQTDWDEQTLWQTYVTLTDLEAVFRSLKSELGLRPVYHHKTERVSGHLFISVLAYHLVHSIRLQLKACGMHLSWDGIRRELDGQDRVTVELKREDGRTVHVRKATRAESRASSSSTTRSASPTVPVGSKSQWYEYEAHPRERQPCSAIRAICVQLRYCPQWEFLSNLSKMGYDYAARSTPPSKSATATHAVVRHNPKRGIMPKGMRTDALSDHGLLHRTLDRLVHHALIDVVPPHLAVPARVHGPVRCREHILPSQLGGRVRRPPRQCMGKIDLPIALGQVLRVNHLNLAQMGFQRLRQLHRKGRHPILVALS